MEEWKTQEKSSSLLYSFELRSIRVWLCSFFHLNCMKSPYPLSRFKTGKFCRTSGIRRPAWAVFISRCRPKLRPYVSLNHGRWNFPCCRCRRRYPISVEAPSLFGILEADQVCSSVGSNLTYKWVKRARKDPLQNYDLYYEAFASRRARGAFEESLEENDEEYDVSEHLVGEHDVDGGNSQHLEGEEAFVNTMRGALNSSSSSLNMASSSRHIVKRHSRSGARGVDPEAKSILKSIATTLNQLQSSRGTSSGASQRVESQQSTFQKCQAVISKMLLDTEQIVLFMEYINWNPNCQEMFLGMNDEQRLFYALRILKTIANNPGPNVQQQYPFYMNQSSPYVGSSTQFRPLVQNVTQQQPLSPPVLPYPNPPHPSFQHPTPTGQQPIPNYQNFSILHEPPIPTPPGPFGGTRSDDF